ncbi:hypothetical protein ACFLQT_01565, partial [Bacteroidota bacterium]
WIVIEFDPPVTGAMGPDLLVTEVSPDDYPDCEKALVYGSNNGTDWVYIGEADNSSNYVPVWNNTTELEFPDGLESAKYIKLVDNSIITDPSTRPKYSGPLDAYDIRCVQALNDYVEIEEETAWGAGDRFNDKNWATYINHTTTCCEETVAWTDFSSLPGYYSNPEEVTLCDGKTMTIEIVNNSTPETQFDGGTISSPFFLEDHSVLENINDIDYMRFRTRAASAEGNFNYAAPNSYTMTWTFDDPLDYKNFFVVGQLLQGNVATITAYAPAPDNSVVNGSLAFEQLKALKSTYTFYEPLSWTASTGVLKKSGTTGSNSKYGFFSIPEGTQIGKIVIKLVDDGTRGSTADEVNYGIGCILCL